MNRILYTKEKIKDILIEYYRIHKISPSFETWKGPPHSVTIARYFDGKWEQALTECNIPLNTIFSQPKQKLKCTICNTDITRSNYSISKFKYSFCSKSCRAKFYNKHRTPKNKEYKKCVVCNNNIFSASQQFCQDCIKLGWHQTFPDKPYRLRTLEYELSICNHKGANRYNKIRGWARYQNKHLLQKCDRCGYNKHVEIAHKKAISTFPGDTLLVDINDRNNLLFLCPNCHWEHDHPNGCSGGS